MSLVNRALPAAQPDPRGMPLGRVSRLSPMHVTFDGREYGPVILTRTAAAASLTVGAQVLIALSDVDTDRLIVIDGIS